MLKQLVLQNRRGLIVATHAVLAAAAYVSAFLLRFDGSIPATYYDVMCITLPVSVGIKLLVLAAYDLHGGIWRYVSLSDALRLAKAVGVSSLVFVAVTSIATQLYEFPRSIFFIDWILTTLLFGASRFTVRAFREVRRINTASGVSEQSLLIVGAGDAGETAVRELLKNESLDLRIAGFLDDDPRKSRLLLHGYPVLGPLADAPAIVRARGITDILIAIPSAPKRVAWDLVARCAGLGVRFRILPAIADFITGRLQAQPIRTVLVEDLLGREPVQLDRTRVSAELRGARVLVTGAGGSIGSELCRQIATFNPERLILLDAAENALFEIDRELGERARHVPRSAIVCDIRHVDAVGRVFETERPSHVFHAAAYKHVPLMERNPDEAILNNVKGTQVVAEAAARYGTAKFVLISSDKAVRPANIMGATKRVTELMIQMMDDAAALTPRPDATGAPARPQAPPSGPPPGLPTRPAAPKCRYAAVRFGNVLGSNGSVVTIFRRQIESGGPVTITHPEMTRFFMTIPEAVELVLQAGSLSRGGEIFVLDMGEPVKIIELARNMIELSGFEPGKDIHITFTGIRPGEKLNEELVAHGEDVIPTEVAKVMVHRRGAGLRTTPDDLRHQIGLLIGAAEDRDLDTARRRLGEILSANDHDVPSVPPRPAP
jgi:FlaA1/EpsC-like NDP-sugar epimerase